MAKYEAINESRVSLLGGDSRRSRVGGSGVLRWMPQWASAASGVGSIYVIHEVSNRWGLLAGEVYKVSCVLLK